MKTKLSAVAVLGVAAVMLTAVAAAGPVAEKQRIAIQGMAGGGFVLTPLTPGALERDTGVATFCCWSSRVVVRDGLQVEINDPLMTLTGKRGALVARNQVEWVDVANGYAVGIVTWRVLRGTGAYAGLTGGGRGAIMELPKGAAKWHREGFLSPR
jgi:hypothetical protein